MLPPAEGKVRQGIGFAMLLSRPHHWFVGTHREPMNARRSWYLPPSRY